MLLFHLNFPSRGDVKYRMHPGDSCGPQVCKRVRNPGAGLGLVGFLLL